MGSSNWDRYDAEADSYRPPRHVDCAAGDCAACEADQLNCGRHFHCEECGQCMPEKTGLCEECQAEEDARFSPKDAA